MVRGAWSMACSPIAASGAGPGGGPNGLRSASGDGPSGDCRRTGTSGTAHRSAASSPGSAHSRPGACGTQRSGSGTCALRTLREDLLHVLHRLLLPSAHLVRMDLVPHSDLLDRLVPAQRFQRHLRLELPAESPVPPPQAHFSGCRVTHECLNFVAWLCSLVVLLRKSRSGPRQPVSPRCPLQSGCLESLYRPSPVARVRRMPSLSDTGLPD